MQLLQQTQEATNERKFMKSQMEKRRRDRMNHSLERLRTMLLQEPQRLGAQHRVEKAEILEHAVLFLQKTRASAAAAASSSSSSSSSSSDGADAGRGQKHTFRDGFSSCLQTAAQFLEPDGKGPWLRAALGASVAGRPESDPAAGVQGRPGDTRPGDARASSSSSLSHTKSILRSLRQKSKHSPHVPHTGASEPCGCPTRSGFPGASRQPRTQKPLQMRRAGKQSPSRSGPVNRTLWRPWP
ncbi:uncharacterized protein ACO6RY_12718 [Pungitius sinensis]